MFILVLHIGNDVKLLIEQLNFCKLGKIVLSGMNLNPYSVLIPPGGVLEFLKIIRFINIMSFIA